jgi:hypothetical protein
MGFDLLKLRVSAAVIAAVVIVARVLDWNLVC